MVIKRILPALIAGIAICTGILFSSASELSANQSLAQCQPKFIVCSNTTLSVYVDSWVANNSSLSFTGDLRQENGEGVGNATLNITWNNTLVDSITTASGGTFEYASPFLVNERAGNYTLNLSFAGASVNEATYLNASYNKTQIRVKHPIRVEVTSITTPVVVEENLSVAGVLKDDDGFALGNEALELYFDGACKNSTTTHSDGNFNLDYTIPPDTTASKHRMSLFHPASYYYFDGWSDDFWVTVKRKTQILLDSKVVGRNTTANVTGILLDNMNIPLMGKNVTLRWWDGTEKNVTTNESGKFAVEFDVGAPLGNTIEVNASFTGSFYYESTSNNTTYTVIRGTRIQLEPKRAIRKSLVNITGALFDDENNKMGDCEILIYWGGGEPESTFTNDQGIFSYPYSILQEHPLGNISITAEFKGNTTYVGTKASVNYTIAARTKLELDPKRVARNASVEITWKVFADNNTLITKENLTIELFWNNSLIGKANASMGKLPSPYLVPIDQDLGSVNVSAALASSEIYEESSNWTYYEIFSATSIELLAEKTFRGIAVEAFRNTTINITGRLFDDQGKGIANHNISLYWRNNTDEHFIGNATANSTGEFWCLHNISLNHSLGDASVIARFNAILFNGTKTTIYDPSESTALYLVRSNTTLLLFPKTERIYKGSAVEINGTILDDQEQVISNLNIDIFWNAIKVKTINATQEGFSFLYNISIAQRVGEVEVKASFRETYNYTSSENITYYEIYSNTTIIISSISELVKNEEFTLQAQLLENCSGVLGAPVPKAWLEVAIAELSLGSSYTDSNGLANFRIAALSPAINLGSNSLVIAYNGSVPYYEPTTCEQVVKVKQRTELALEIEARVEAGREFECLASLTPKLKAMPIRIVLTLSNGETENASIIVKHKGEEFPYYNNGTADFGLLTDSEGSLSFSIVTSFTGWLEVRAEVELAGTNYEECYLPSNITEHVNIYKPEEYAFPSLLYLLFLPILSIPLVGYYAMRKYQLAKMRKIIEEAKGELVAGSEYVKAILALYRKLSSLLKKFGFLRRDFETFREFEHAVKRALPIDGNLDRFIGIIEEVRYSQHEIGEAHRSAAITNFQAVERSIRDLEVSLKRR